MAEPTTGKATTATINTIFSTKVRRLLLSMS